MHISNIFIQYDLLVKQRNENNKHRRTVHFSFRSCKIAHIVYTQVAVVESILTIIHTIVPLVGDCLPDSSSFGGCGLVGGCSIVSF